MASPLGFSPTTRQYYETTLLPAIAAAGLHPLDPWADPGDATKDAIDAAHSMPPGPDRTAAFATINHRLATKNERDIRACDAVLAILDGPDVDSGTAAEIGFAAALGKPVVGLRLDLRRTGDNEATLVNLQVEHWLTAATRTLVDAIAELR